MCRCFCYQLNPHFLTLESRHSKSCLIYRECIRGIGEDMLKRAFEILEQDEDNLEVNLLTKDTFDGALYFVSQ